MAETYNKKWTFASWNQTGQNDHAYIAISSSGGFQSIHEIIGPL